MKQYYIISTAAGTIGKCISIYTIESKEKSGYMVNIIGSTHLTSGLSLVGEGWAYRSFKLDKNNNIIPFIFKHFAEVF